MKKHTLLAIVLLFVSFNLFSQFEKNDVKLTVSVLPLLGSSDTFTSGLNGFVIKPGIGYFIDDKTSIELNFTYSTMNDLIVGFTQSYYNSYAFVPTLRNSFINNEKLRVFGEFGFGLGSIKYNADDNNFNTQEHEDLSGGIAVISLGLGANYFFNDNFGLEVILPYINSKNITSESSNTIYSGIGPTLGLTFRL